MTRRIKDALKRCLFLIYKFATALGIHIVPVHYYTSEPDIIELKRTVAVWAKPSSMPGIHIDLEDQIARLRDCCLPYQDEYYGNRFYIEGVEMGYGPGFGFIEAQALYSLIRHYSPARIVEIGSGVSTYISYRALQRNQSETGRGWQITCIEPYPSPRLRHLSTSEPNVHLINLPVQQAPMDVMLNLAENDILFVDSSHIVKAGSDVNYMILEVLPRLQPGVIVHFHDIYFPYDYQRDVLHTFIHSNEASLLRAFLTLNAKFKILFSLSYLHYERTEELKRIFPEYVPRPGKDGLEEYKAPGHFPSSTWLQNIR